MKKIALFLSIMFVACSIHAQTIASLQSEISALQKQVAALSSNRVLALAPYVALDFNTENGVVGPNIIFHDVNVHITNGTFNTATANGRGNLIIGYNEPGSLSTIGRGGSHNLVIGQHNDFAGYEGLISGEYNSNSGQGNTNIGFGHQTSGTFNAAVGGEENGVTGSVNVVIGGYQNSVDGNSNSVDVGGQWNAVESVFAVTMGGFDSLNNYPFRIILPASLLMSSGYPNAAP